MHIAGGTAVHACMLQSSSVCPLVVAAPDNAPSQRGPCALGSGSLHLHTLPCQLMHAPVGKHLLNSSLLIICDEPAWQTQYPPMSLHGCLSRHCDSFRDKLQPWKQAQPACFSSQEQAAHKGKDPVSFFAQFFAASGAHPNPRERPLVWSCMIWASVMSPNWPKYSRKSSAAHASSAVHLPICM